MRRKRYKSATICCDIDLEVGGRWSIEIQPDRDGLCLEFGNVEFAVESRKTDAALVDIHREKTFVPVQSPSRRQCFARRNAQSDAGPAARERSEKFQRSLYFTRTECHIHRRPFSFFLERQVSSGIILNGCNEANLFRKCHICTLANLNLLLCSHVKLDFVSIESDGVCHGGRIVCRDVNGVIALINAPFTREVRTLAERDNHRLQAFLISVVFDCNRRSNLKDAPCDLG